MIGILMIVDVHCVDCFPPASFWAIFAPYAAAIGAIVASLIAYNGIKRQIQSNSDAQERVFKEERERKQAEIDRRNIGIRRRLEGINFAAFNHVVYLLAEPLFDLENVRIGVQRLSDEIMRPEIADALTTPELGRLFDYSSVLNAGISALASYEGRSKDGNYDKEALKALSRGTARSLLQSIGRIASALGDDFTAKKANEASDDGKVPVIVTPTETRDDARNDEVNNS